MTRPKYRQRQLRRLSPWRILRWLPALFCLFAVTIRARSPFGWLVVLTTLVSVRARGNRIVVGRGFRSRGLYVRMSGHNNRLEIGDHVALSGRIDIGGNNVTVRIGDRCDAKQVKIIARSRNVTIGADCLIAAGCEIRSSDMHHILDRRTWRPLNRPRAVTIGRHVWIASHVSILRGAEIAEGCVVGTRSVVRGSFPESHCVIAGVPAKVIRSGVIWKR